MIDKDYCNGEEKKLKECSKHEPYCDSGNSVCPYYNGRINHE